MKIWYAIYTDHCQTCRHTRTYRIRMYGSPPAHDELKYINREIWCDEHEHHEKKRHIYAQH